MPRLRERGVGAAFLRQAVVLVALGGVWKSSIPWFYQFVLHSQEWGPGWAGLQREGVAAEGIMVILGSVPQSHQLQVLGSNLGNSQPYPVRQFAVQTSLAVSPREKIIGLVYSIYFVFDIFSSLQLYLLTLKPVYLVESTLMPVSATDGVTGTTQDEQIWPINTD